MKDTRFQQCRHSCMSDSKMFIRYTGQEINPQSACRDNLRVLLDRMKGSNNSPKTRYRWGVRG